jgi:hypothetical protein
MASIQQSYNQLFGALAGASTAGAYMYRQSGAYKAGQAEKSAKTIEKTLGASKENLAQMTPEQRTAYLERQKLATEQRATSATLSPNEKRAEAVRQSYQQREEIKNTLSEIEKEEAGKLAEEAEAEAKKAYEEEQREAIESGELIISDDGSLIETLSASSAPTKEQLELEKAHETIRRTILGQDLVGSKTQQTLNYQNALNLIREKEGLYGTIR